MEKLIELLNEYSKNIWYFNEEDLQWQTKAWILSKEFWWIIRLVENDKIDIDAYKTVYSWDLDKRKTLTMSSNWDEFYQVIEHWVYESLLMLLSIQDNPIDFLCEILK